MTDWWMREPVCTYTNCGSESETTCPYEALQILKLCSQAKVTWLWVIACGIIKCSQQHKPHYSVGHSLLLMCRITHAKCKIELELCHSLLTAKKQQGVVMIVESRVRRGASKQTFEALSTQSRCVLLAHYPPVVSWQRSRCMGCHRSEQVPGLALCPLYVLGDHICFPRAPWERRPSPSRV